MFDKQNIIKWSIISFIVIVVIVLSIFIYKKATSSSKASSNSNSNSNSVVNTSISITLSGPISITPYTSSIQISQISNLSVSYFLQSTINSSNILPLSFNNTNWTSISINNSNVPINNGVISSNSSLKAFLGGSIPDSINIKGSFIVSCDQSQYPTNCHPCKSETGVCTSSGNWECSPVSTTCPSQDILETCCVNATGPYSSCDKGIVTCGDCPRGSDGKPTLDCGYPGCNMIGPVCTATGWICEENRLCPDNDWLQAHCNTDRTKTLSCITYPNGSTKIISSYCAQPTSDQISSCPTSADNTQGLVCKSSSAYPGSGGVNTWECEPNTLCPDMSTMIDYCKNSSIGPVPSCDPNHPKVICSTCDSLPKPDCPESCLGHGLVCTATGYVCLPGVKCPGNDFDMSQCCGNSNAGHMIGYCDNTSNCVKCKCPGINKACDDAVCGGITVPEGTTSGQTTCCTEPPCGKSVIGNQAMCCPSENICYSNGKLECCGDGTICINGSCSPICGYDETGAGMFCTDTQTCVMVENITPDIEANLKQKYGDKINFNNNTAYVCLDNNSSCYFEENPINFPAGIDNYFPCYNFPVSSVADYDNPGPGYCTDINDSPIDTCMKYTDEISCNSNTSCTFTKGLCLPNQSNVVTCSEHQDSKSCTGDSKCKWRNIMQYVGQSAQNNIDSKIYYNTINNELALIKGVSNGNYCDPSNNTQSFQRIIGLPGSPSCEVDDCWARIGQPGITDVQFFPSQGTNPSYCIALQSCNSVAGSGVQTSGYETTTNNGVVNANKTVNQFSTTLPQSITSSSFPVCSSNPQCPIESSIYQCKSDSGEIISCNCQSPQICIDNDTCECPPGPAPYTKRTGLNCDMYVTTLTRNGQSDSNDIGIVSGGNPKQLPSGSGPTLVYDPSGDNLCLASSPNVCLHAPIDPSQVYGHIYGVQYNNPQEMANQPGNSNEILRNISTDSQGDPGQNGGQLCCDSSNCGFEYSSGCDGFVGGYSGNPGSSGTFYGTSLLPSNGDIPQQLYKTNRLNPQ